MSYYLRLLPNRHLHAWKIDADIAYRVGVSDPQRHPETYFIAEPSMTIWDTMRARTRWFDEAGGDPFHKAELEPGQFYRRIARLTEQGFPESRNLQLIDNNENDAIAVARSQLNVLTRQLDRICQTVHPTAQTFGAYGHDIRNLLILACTEVEAHWRGVLVGNSVNKNQFTTRDYVALRPVMRLDEYAVKFPNYPWLDPIKPFGGWGSTGKPTQDLGWYHSYNAVKHDRERQFERATLHRVFEAVSACVVMMAAQFGFDFAQGAEVESFFRFCEFPEWLPSEVYIYPYAEVSQGWSPVNYNFPL